MFEFVFLFLFLCQDLDRENKMGLVLMKVVRKRENIFQCYEVQGSTRR